MRKGVRGITRSGLWNGREFRCDWVAHQEPQWCACGCGLTITVKPQHRRIGIPRFFAGHNMRAEAAGADQEFREWLAVTPTPACGCGCGTAIPLTKQHYRTQKLPRFLRGHSCRAPWKGESPEQWVERQLAPLCACGCGQPVQIKPAHRRAGIPVFRWGHHARFSSYKGVDLWVERNQGKHFCACGCGTPITILVAHHSHGTPRYVQNHSPRPQLGVGPDHPAYVKDRRRVKTRKGQAFAPFVRRQIFERDGGRCVRCGATECLDCDHIIPIERGGTGTVENGQVLCVDCHRKKNAAERREWFARRRLARASNKGEFSCLSSAT